MKRFLSICVAVFSLCTLAGCLASSTSPDGVNCNFSQEKPLWEMPVACQGR